MSRQRLAFAWIACFAVLFNMLAMPLSGSGGAMASAPTEQVLWGSFCSSSGMKMVAISLGKFEQGTPQKDNHSTMQHCWCCSGSAPSVALTGQAPQLYLDAQLAHRRIAHSKLDSPTPRQQWPSLNPRASPLV
ncbi:MULTISPECIES: DUF2946 domain-containing protein [Pseudomonas]|jgi:hypothetical protein|uniref:DUF2946 domain-containing protein n=1 Tax=Pseudomonas TaxID=286 RepID=UPI000E30DF77|nr:MULTISPECIES: DUF2946 domain-containing protein [Pseudomonas]AXP06823.1 DUF2946 domain-containing protein [Pseudomonas fluorescens]MCD9117744.1 DUF2946 domain-containing protein [Pseudomonas bijieensis]UQI31820.1 DUF2946 domain-containing protein [Pseudomonas bijieensis]WLH63614.1 DUF2946 domain-containing protein [Pseudomonas sp. FP2300]BBH31131.1 hypothetical protein PBDP_0668 [Pseudomonas sp. St290]